MMDCLRCSLLQLTVLAPPAVAGDIRDPGFLAGLRERLALAHEYADLLQLLHHLLRAELLLRHSLTPSSELKTTALILV